MVTEGFMHIDITEELKSFISPSQKRPTYHHQTNTADTNSAQQPSKEVTKEKPVPIAILGNSNEIPPKAFTRKIRLELELFDNDEYNISHISISAVRKKSQNEVFMIILQ
jgi:hypothetical protein